MSSWITPLEEVSAAAGRFRDVALEEVREDGPLRRVHRPQVAPTPGASSRQVRTPGRRSVHGGVDWQPSPVPQPAGAVRRAATEGDVADVEGLDPVQELSPSPRVRTKTVSSVEDGDPMVKPFGEASRLTLSWTVFQDVVAVAIILNMLVVCLETDNPEWPFWNLLDGARFVLLTRLLRMYRLVRMNPKLNSFVVLLVSMASTFAWILANVVMLCFVLSIVMTRLVGPSGLLQVQGDTFEHVQSLFLNIPTSLFTLFQLTTVDNWVSIATPMIEMSASWRLFFVAFITFVSWTCLSLLTAVASETMLTSTKTKQSEEATIQEARLQGLSFFLQDQFVNADRDENGTLDKREFIRLMKRPSMQLEMGEYGIELRVRDLEQTWNTFDIDDSGELSIDELVDGFSFLLQGLSTKNVASVNYTLKRFVRKTETASDTIMGCLNDVAQRQQDILDMFEEKEREESDIFDKLFRPQD